MAEARSAKRARTASDAEAAPGPADAADGSEAALLFCTICANNVNRSTMAHDYIRDAGMRVCSYGAGSMVRLPGKNGQQRPYPFGTPYERMYADLVAEDRDFYVGNDVLPMLERDIKTKLAPQRWQDEDSEVLSRIDVAVCLEERIFDAVVEDLLGRTPTDLKPLHVICLDVKDDASNAISGGNIVLELARRLNEHSREALEEEVAPLMDAFMEEHGVVLLYSMHFL